MRYGLIGILYYPIMKFSIVYLGERIIFFIRFCYQTIIIHVDGKKCIDNIYNRFSYISQAGHQRANYPQFNLFFHYDMSKTNLKCLK